MNIKNTKLHHFILITLLSSLVISITHADDSDDKRQYGYMGHMGSGYMGSGHMMGYGHMGSGPMGYGRMGMGHMGYGRFGMGTMGPMGMHMLDLSDSQRKSIRDIHKGTRTQQLALHDELAEHADELHSLYKKDKPNAKKNC